MRRAYALLVVPLLAVAAVAGCGSSSSSVAATDANKAVSVAGSFGAEPKVAIPAEKAASSLYTKTVIRGSGAPLTRTESVVGNFSLYDWSGKTHKLVGSTFTSGTPALLSGSQMMPGLESALLGQKAGSRVLAVIPPKDGYGPQGNPQFGVGGSDTLVFVVDLIKEFSDTAAASGAHVSNGGGGLPTVSFPAAGKAPTIKVPSGVTPPKKLTATVLVKGTGSKVTNGQTLIVQYVGVNWRTGKAFDSSWSRTMPYAYTIGSNSGGIPGWSLGLAGQTVGSRVMLVIPPADGYGKTGFPQAGIKGTDTLVFAVDIVGAINP